jgi:hypothetical protein
VNKRRLLKLADLLETDAKNRKGIRFDLSTWGNVEAADKPVLSCNTTACAMGLAAISGIFKKQGLDYELTPSGNIAIHVKGAYGGFSAAAELFSISHDESDWLFDYPSYGEAATLTGAKGERMVAKRIRDFVAGKASLPAE